jgi:hypothetical protein
LADKLLAVYMRSPTGMTSKSLFVVVLLLLLLRTYNKINKRRRNPVFLILSPHRNHPRPQSPPPARPPYTGTISRTPLRLPLPSNFNTRSPKPDYLPPLPRPRDFQSALHEIFSQPMYERTNELQPKINVERPLKDWPRLDSPQGPQHHSTTTTTAR